MSYYSDEIKRLKELELDEKCKSECVEAAKRIRMMYDAYCEVGFDDSEAYELLTISMKKNI